MNPETEEVRRAPRPSALTPGIAGADCAKEARPDVTYIDNAPDNQVVLSPRIEYLARQVGGCQTDALLALLRRVMYESISQRKY